MAVSGDFASRENFCGCFCIRRGEPLTVNFMPTNRLIYAASETDADLFYATQFFAPDAFLLAEINGKRIVVLSELEIDRGRTEAQVDEVVSLKEIAAALPQKERSSLAKIAAAFLKKRRVKKVEVPQSFPLGLARELESEGVKLSVAGGASLWPQREFKTAAELKLMQRASRITETGLARAMEVLRAAEVSGKKLLWSGKTLTSEILRAEIESAILRVGGKPANTIVAGGTQACDPHERGHGPLMANSLIVIDIFPRDAKSGYHGDMTRTVVRGRASDAQRRLWETVWEGQKRMLKAMAPGVFGEKLEKGLRQFFAENGYPTEQRDGRNVGFFHGVGHGLGLEVHESPRFGKTVFKPGQVITVEPGLYFPEIGGARIEDVVAVSEKGIQMLSKFPKELELR